MKQPISIQKIFIELPTWLGDAVMTTPALASIHQHFPDASITLFGTTPAIEALRATPFVSRTLIDTTRQGFRPYRLFQTARTLGPFDLALSFRSHLATRLLLYAIQAPKRHFFQKDPQPKRHQVEHYQAFINQITGQNNHAKALHLNWPRASFARPTLGIHPGATYGSAKRWYPKRYAHLISMLEGRYDILLFGTAQERPLTEAIEQEAKAFHVRNITNLAGKTDIPTLCGMIGGLDLFLTGDSGPMHIAAAYQTPTVALFGPTDPDQTAPWRHQKCRIIRHPLACSPCLRRTCPLKHHRCMQDITTQEVYGAIKELEENR